MVSFRMSKGEVAAKRLVSETNLFTLTEALGAVESLVERPYSTTHASSVGSRFEAPSDLVRLSVGIEDIQDLLSDLSQAFAKLK
jgi:cystathionine gamma-synthase